jgi:glycosyltransferase involved in cell wall biosynthesis
MFPVIEPYGYPFPYAGWIPDFQHVYLPHFFDQNEIRQTEIKYRAIAQAPLVVLSSRMALDDFISIYPERASNGRVLNFVSYAEPAYFEGAPIAIQRKYDLPDAFFLVSNQFWAHKNHELVIDAVAELNKKGVKPCVVCTGNTKDHRAPGFFDQMVERIRGAGISDRFRFLGLISRSDQMNLMRRCLAVIQPSLFEGWSTVVEDARGLGKPMLLSDFPVHLEQNPPNSFFFPRNNPIALAECMRHAMLTLLPGPDSVAEDAARSSNAAAMRNYARSFLAIAAEVVEMARR